MVLRGRFEKQLKNHSEHAADFDICVCRIIRPGHFRVYSIPNTEISFIPAEFLRCFSDLHAEQEMRSRMKPQQACLDFIESHLRGLGGTHRFPYKSGSDSQHQPGAQTYQHQLHAVGGHRPFGKIWFIYNSKCIAVSV